jgi:hypothetical protein
MNEFIDFIKNNKKNKIPNNNINCSELSTYYHNNEDFISLLDNLQIQINKVDNMINNTVLPNIINGIYVDYLIRYKICCILKKEFKDYRCDNYISGFFTNISIEEINNLPYKIKKNINVQSDIRDINIELYYEIKNIVENSYNNMKNFISNNNDILNVSLCHPLYFNENYAYNYFNYFDEKNFKDNYYNLEKYIKEKIKNKNEVLCNPTLGSIDLKIKADADLIIDKELIDIKCSSLNIGENMNDFIQLFIYSCLYFKKTGIKCEKITIFNPILNYEKYIELKNWNNFDKILELLMNRIN